MTLKMIDLLERISSGENIPNRIRIHDEDWYWNNHDGYVTKDSLKRTLDYQTCLFKKYRIDFMLNDTIDIFFDKQIEHIELVENSHKKPVQDQLQMIKAESAKVKRKINELIDIVNELESRMK